jgi:hypothetical protein
MDPASAPPVNPNTRDLNTDVPTGMGTDTGMRTRRSTSGRVEAQSHTDIERNLALPPPAIQVLFVLLPNSLTLDWAGPAEVLRSANSVLQGMGQPPRFAVGFVGPRPNR